MSDTATGSELVDEIRTWLEENWDPDLTVAQWWERVGTAGWSAPNLPADAYGKGLSRSDGVVIAKEIGSYGALGAPSGLGLLLAAPTIAARRSSPTEDMERDVAARHHLLVVDDEAGGRDDAR